jgi:hypothetical protein
MGANRVPELLPRAGCLSASAIAAERAKHRNPEPEDPDLDLHIASWPAMTPDLREDHSGSVKDVAPRRAVGPAVLES